MDRRGRHAPAGASLSPAPGERGEAHSMFILSPLRPLVGQRDVIEALALLAVDPGLGGAVLIGEPGSGRGALASLLRLLLPEDAPFVSAGPGDDVLHDHLDWEATLRTGRPVTRPSLWRRAAGGVLLLTRGEDVDVPAAAQLAAALRRPEAPRLFISAQIAADPFAEYRTETEHFTGGRPAPECDLSRGLSGLAPLGPRLAFWLTVQPLAGGEERAAVLEANVAHSAPMPPFSELPDPSEWRRAVAEAARRLPVVAGHEALMERLCREIARLGPIPPAVDIMAWRAARARAALHGRSRITASDAARALDLVVAPRVHRSLDSQRDLFSEGSRQPREQGTGGSSREQAAPSSHGHSEHIPQRQRQQPRRHDGQPAAEPSAPRTPLPPELLPVYEAVQEQHHRRLAARLSRPFSRQDESSVPPSRRPSRTPVPKGRPVSGRAATAKRSPLGGRPASSPPTSKGPIAWAPTLHAALPWQRVRPRRRGLAVALAPEDIRRREPRLPQTTLFIIVVDTSGSMGAARTRAAKGLIDALLQRAYTGRSEVCLIQAGGAQARIVVPPTRSLRRAREALAAMATGGATPLADALRLAGDVVEKRRRRGDGGPAAVIVLSDGRGNVPGPWAERRGLSPEDEIAVLAQRLHRFGAPAVVLDRDRAGRPADDARAFAQLMQAPFLPL